MYSRLLNLSKLNSFFLFGARGTGKTSLTNHFLIQLKIKKFIKIDFLEAEWELMLKKSPDKLKEIIMAEKSMPEWVILDEVQKVPEILDIVHSLMVEHKLKFILTGSSARKLKRNSANLLAGRAHEFKLFPLTHIELENDFDLAHALNYGTLPLLFASTYQNTIEKKRFLNTYCSVYLKEEIIAEQIIRKLPPFQRFLEIAASSNGEILNFSKLARLTKTDDKSVERYYQVLEETLLGFFLYGYDKSIRKQIIQSPKFYFFDLGVMRALKGEISMEVLPSNYEYGKLFESFVITEIHRLNHYYEADFKLHYLKSKDGQEIDLVITKPNKDIILLEIKSGIIDTPDDTKWLDYFSNLSSFKKAKKILLTKEKHNRIFQNSVHIMNWQTGIKEIFDL